MTTLTTAPTNGTAFGTGMSEDRPMQTQSNPFAKTLPLAIDFKGLGDKRKIDKGKVSAGDADVDLVNATKTIIDCAEFKAISTAKSAIKSFLDKKKVLGGQRLFRDGTYPIPIALIPAVEERLVPLIAGYWRAVDKFLGVYEDHRRAMLTRLGSLGSEADYPTVDKARAAFSVVYNWLNFGAPDALKDVSIDIWKREAKKIEESCAVVVDDVRLALRRMFQELLDHMVETLKPGPDGKKKTFRDTLVGNMKEFMRDFQARDITGDEDLQRLVEKCRGVLAGKTPDALRKDMATRELTAEALEKIKGALDGAIGVKPGRKISFRKKAEETPAS